MLHQMTQLYGCTVAATDGELGRIGDVWFDDSNWIIGYFALDAAHLGLGRALLVPPALVTRADWGQRHLHIDMGTARLLDRLQVFSACSLAGEQAWRLRCGLGYAYGPAGKRLPACVGLAPPHPQATAAGIGPQCRPSHAATHLHSADEVIGFDLLTSESPVGHIDDFMVDGKTWKIQLLVVDTRNCWPGMHTSISPRRIARVSWGAQMMVVDLPRERLARRMTRTAAGMRH